MARTGGREGRKRRGKERHITAVLGCFHTHTPPPPTPSGTSAVAAAPRVAFFVFSASLFVLLNHKHYCANIICAQPLPHPFTVVVFRLGRERGGDSLPFQHTGTHSPLVRHGEFCCLPSSPLSYRLHPILIPLSSPYFSSPPPTPSSTPRGARDANDMRKRSGKRCAFASRSNHCTQARPCCLPFSALLLLCVCVCVLGGERGGRREEGRTRSGAQCPRHGGRGLLLPSLISHVRIHTHAHVHTHTERGQEMRPDDPHAPTPPPPFKRVHEGVQHEEGHCDTFLSAASLDLCVCVCERACLWVCSCLSRMHKPLPLLSPLFVCYRCIRLLFE